MQLSNATDKPGVETSPRGWHTNFLPPVPKKLRHLLPLPCLYLFLPPQKTETSLALAFFFPCWAADGGHNTNTTLINSRLYTAWQEDIQEPGQGRGTVQRPLYTDTTSSAAATGLAGPAVLSSVICCLAVSKKQITLKVEMGVGGEWSIFGIC